MDDIKLSKMMRDIKKNEGGGSPKQGGFFGEAGFSVIPHTNQGLNEGLLSKSCKRTIKVIEEDRKKFKYRENVPINAFEYLYYSRKLKL